MKMQVSYATFIFCLIFSMSLQAQMLIDGELRFGDEWINHSQKYYKITVSEDGVYRVSQSELAAAGVFSGGAAPDGNQFRLYFHGEEIPIYVSTGGGFGASDFIEFYGKRNNGDLDVHLYEDASWQGNPEYSL